MRERAVLVFAFHEEHVLLIRKLRGLGTGKINGPGGRLEGKETFAEAGIREVREETGCEVEGLVEIADLEFRFTHGYELEVRAFRARWSAGIPRACDEADPFWCPVSDIPWNRMWADDPLWLPPALQGSFVNASFLFHEDQMLQANLRVADRSTAVNLG